MSDHDRTAAPADEPLVTDERLKKAEEFIEEAEGAVSRFQGWLDRITTVLLIAMSLFHLYAAVQIVPAQVIRPVHVGFVLLLVYLLFPIAPRFRNRLMWWDVVCAVLGVATIFYLLDGGDNVSNFTHVNMPFPFPDALQEFSVETSSLPARNGLHPAAW